MGYCPNCKATLTCSCQNRTSKKGVAGCSKCINQLNGGIAPQVQTEALPKNTPTNITGVYQGPGKQE